MKVLMILDREFPPDLRVENEMEVLIKDGHEVHLACYSRKNRPEYEKTEFCQIHRRSISNIVFKSSVGALVTPVYFNFWRKFLRDLFREQNFDAIHVHDLPLVKVGDEFSKEFHIPLTADLHENWPAYLRISQHTKSIPGRLLSPDKLWTRYEQNILSGVDNIIVVVDEAKKRLVGMGLDPKKIHIVSNTLNRDHFSLKEHPKTGSEVILFYAGGLNYHRGLQVVIKAMSIVKDSHPEIRCWILGEGSYQENLKKLSQELELEDRIIFHGWVPYSEMTEKLMQSDYALIPHLKSDHTDSTLPHKLFQYMYAKKPVITSDCDPIARIIRETNSGYIYSSTEPESLASILMDLKNIDTSIQGSNGSRWVDKKYNWEHDSEILINIYS